MNKIASCLSLAFVSLLSFASAEKPAAASDSSVCYSNDDCDSLQFCNIEGAGDNTCGGAGVCAPRGINLMCPMIDVRACGCDGNPVANACLAHKAGVSIDPMPFKPASISGSTLAAQPWMDGAQTNFYLFDAGAGTFEQRIEPPCTRATPVHCMIAIQSKKGSFQIAGSVIELDYENGDVALFDSQVDCNGTWHLVSEDSSATTLVVSTIVP